MNPVQRPLENVCKHSPIIMDLAILTWSGVRAMPELTLTLTLTATLHADTIYLNTDQGSHLFAAFYTAIPGTRAAIDLLVHCHISISCLHTHLRLQTVTHIILHMKSFS